MHSFEILRRPIITEKSTLMQDEGRYVFEVATGTTKHQIRIAVQDAFDVTVTKVNTMNMRGKSKKYGPRATPKQPWQKAIVPPSPGATLPPFDGV